MRRFLIFTALYPPLVLVGLIATVSEIQRNLGIWELLWMLGVAYLVGLIPAWFSAGVDWALSSQPNYLRLPGAAVAGAGAVMIAITAFHFGEVLGARMAVLMISLIGGIPAAVCSWLSDESMRSVNAK
ncbi:hypothetical protein BH10PSE11_BH10PSE11_03130 [soil metagenome]